MNSKSLGARKFTVSDQRWFAAFSGDFNPIHMDPIAARRLLFGGVIAHGVHAALWALQLHLQSLPPPERRIARIRCRFIRPILLDQKVAVSRTCTESGVVSLQVFRGDTVLLLVEVQAGGAAPAIESAVVSASLARSQSCRDRQFAELAGAIGHLPLFLDLTESRTSFAAVLASLGSSRLAGIAALSRLVGMECPGMHSVFSNFAIDFLPQSEDPTCDPMLSYRVERADTALAPIRIELTGPAMRGTVTAFYRPKPQLQADMQAVSRLVKPGECAGQRVLVIGGSRGLGEVAAKIIACGGGHPIITFHSGEADAQQVQQEIVAAGGRCEVLRMDVLRPRRPFAELRRRHVTLTHLYFFATPRITRAKAAVYEPGRLRDFMAYYVDSFYNVCQLASQIATGLRVFYPSTAFLDEGTRDNPEYLIAKAAGEALCCHLARFGSELSIHVKRLPRIATDQTATILNGGAVNALETMLPIVREMTP